jgi:hypothetical protein
MIFTAGFAHLEHGESALAQCRGNEPARVAGDEEAQIVSDAKRFLAFELDQLVVAGDQILDLALGGQVAGPECLVGMKHEARNKVRVESPGDPSRIADGLVVPCEQRADDLADLCLAGSGFAANGE